MRAKWRLPARAGRKVCHVYTTSQGRARRRVDGKRIRQTLIANGVAGKIETLVAELIGIAPVAILPGDDTDPEEADAD